MRARCVEMSMFTVADCDGGRKTVVLIGPTAYGRDMHDMDRLHDAAAP